MRDNDLRIIAALAEIASASRRRDQLRKDCANGILSRESYLAWELGYRYIRNIHDHLTGATWESQKEAEG